MCRAFLEGASSQDKVFVPVEGGFHEVMFEEDGPALVNEMITWILSRAEDNGNAAGAAKM